MFLKVILIADGNILIKTDGYKILEKLGTTVHFGL